jgi:hypothetical protein
MIPKKTHQMEAAQILLRIILTFKKYMNKFIKSKMEKNWQRGEMKQIRDFLLKSMNKIILTSKLCLIC